MRAALLALVVVLAGCEPSLSEDQAARAGEGIAGVVRTERDCRSPIEGFRCTIDAYVEDGIDADQVTTVVESLADLVVEDVTGVRVIAERPDGDAVLLVARVSLSESSVGVPAWIAMRDRPDVREGVVRVVGTDRSTDAVVGDFGTAADVASALITDDIPLVGVTGPADTRLSTGLGVPVAEHALATAIADRFDLTGITVEAGRWVVYVVDAATQDQVRDLADRLPERDAVESFDVYVG